MIRHATEPTPVGLAFLAMGDRGLVGLYFVDESDESPAFERLRHDFPGEPIQHDPEGLSPIREAVRNAIATEFEPESVPLDPRGTPFQRNVWDALRAIPRGTTITYGELTRRLGLPAGAARAVGAACGANPISLFIPCHRVITGNGALRGYRWGLERKRELLRIEGAIPAEPLLPFN